MSTPTLPPELMAPEEREARAAELEYEIGREWVRFAITEGVVLWLPLTVFMAVYVLTDAVSDSALPVVVGVGIGVSVLLTLYWFLARIRPRQEELHDLRGGET
jgi:hypothetical protein